MFTSKTVGKSITLCCAVSNILRKHPCCCNIAVAMKPIIIFHTERELILLKQAKCYYKMLTTLLS